MDTTKQRGDRGEEVACEYLQGLGYRLLKRNYFIRGGEIDIVAQDGEYLVFIEVKTRWSHKFGLPVDSITPWKLKHLLKAARLYVAKAQWGDRPFRLDFVSVDFANDPKNPLIEVIRDITTF